MAETKITLATDKQWELLVKASQKMIDHQVDEKVSKGTLGTGNDLNALGAKDEKINQVSKEIISDLADVLIKRIEGASGVFKKQAIAGINQKRDKCINDTKIQPKNKVDYFINELKGVPTIDLALNQAPNGEWEAPKELKKFM